MNLQQFARRLTRAPRRRDRAVAAALGLTAALLLGEAAARLGGLDWRLLRPALYWQQVDLASHQADADPRVMYRLKPGRQEQRCDSRPYAVTINALGARGPERPAAKPAGVFRIVCVGGSHVYGACVGDEETWPAQLERRLNATAPGRYEVWNFGTSAYVAAQMAAVADEAIQRLNPDLVLFEVTNTGTRAFLWGSDPAAYFARAPELWEALAPPAALSQPFFLPYRARSWLLRNSALARCLAAPLLRRRQAHEAGESVYERWNVAAFRDLYRRRAGATKIALLLQSIDPQAPEDFRPYYAGLRAPTHEWRTDGLPPEYGQTHPPAYVLAYQAERFAQWLRASGLIPPE